jgi:hypothetical protein
VTILLYLNEEPKIFLLGFISIRTGFIYVGSPSLAQSSSFTLVGDCSYLLTFFSAHRMLIHVLKVGWYPPWQWFRNIGVTHVPHNSEKKKCDLVWTQFIVMLSIAYFFRYWMKPTNYLMWNLRKPSMKSLMRFLKTGELSFFLQLWPKRFVNIEVYTRDETINSLDIWIDDKVMGFYVFYYVWFIYFVFHVNLTFLA